MKIRLALLEKDQSYLNRIVSAFSTKYADKFEIYSFTDPGVALATLALTGDQPSSVRISSNRR